MLGAWHGGAGWAAMRICTWLAWAGGCVLAERTGTTVRTVERDIARLVAASVPIQVRRGPGGGYRLDVRPVLPPVTLTPGEAAALIASLVAVGPYTSATARSALDKLLSALAPPASGSH
jgi:predicted DNA-binding transcriptional regulator YafY